MAAKNYPSGRMSSVAADIVKTIAIELTFVSLGLLAGLVLVRTFLSWTLVLEIDGCWPWQRDLASAVHSEHTVPVNQASNKP